MPALLSVAQSTMIKKHQYILKKLASSSAQQRKKILRNAPNALFKTLHIVIKLLADDKLNLTKKNQAKVNRHRNLIKSVSNLKQNAIKKKIQNQTGGFLGMILKTALPLITGLLSRPRK